MYVRMAGFYRGRRCAATGRGAYFGMRQALSALLLVVAAACAAPKTSPTPYAGAYDIVIANGRIVDGTGNAWFYGDVGIVKDRIARITPAGVLANAPAARRVDATGMVVSP